MVFSIKEIAVMVRAWFTQRSKMWFPGKAGGRRSDRPSFRPGVEALEERLVLTGPAASLGVSVPSTATAGTSFPATLTAYDVSGLVVTNYAAAVNFTASDGQTVTASAVTWNQGVGTATLTLTKVDTLTLGATGAAAAGGTIGGTSGSIGVGVGSLAELVVAAPASAPVMQTFGITVTAEDAYGNTVKTDNATAVLNVKNAGTNLGKFSVPLVNGVGTASGAMPYVGSSSFTSTGVPVPTTTYVAINPGPVSWFLFSGIASSMNAGTSATVTVTAEDTYGNTATAFNGAVNLAINNAGALTATDSATNQNGIATLTNGVGTFTLTAGHSDAYLGIALASIRASAVVKSTTIYSAISKLAINPGPAAMFALSGPSTMIVGTPAQLLITAEDLGGDPVPTYNSQVTLSSADLGLTASHVPIVNGVGSILMAPMHTDAYYHVASLTITASDGKIASSPFSVTALAGPAWSFTLAAPSSAIVGLPFAVALTAYDVDGDIVTNYSAPVTWASSGQQSFSVSAVSWNQGVGTAMVTVAGADTLTLQATVGSSIATSGSIGVVNDWFNLHLSDPGVRALARTDYTSHGQIGYSDMLGLFAEVESNGAVTNTEFQSLQALVYNPSAVNMPGYVQVLANKLVNGDAANANYNSLNANNEAQTSALGNLYVGSSATQLQELVNKWFLGVDYPSTAVAVDGGISPSYVLLNSNPNLQPVPLFDGGVNYYDVQQGQLGDCWLVASLAEVAAQDPTSIQNMFINNGNGTWSVCFYHNGVADYVTVDANLPGGGSIAKSFASINYSYTTSSSTKPIQGQALWVALAEKAYAQENAEGWLPSNNPGADAYNALNESSTFAFAGTDIILSALTGLTASGNNTIDGTSLAAAWQNGKSIVLGTPDLPSGATNLATVNGANIVPTHTYAVVGYNASTQVFTLFNPWGNVGGGFLLNGAVVGCPEFLYPTAQQLAGTSSIATGSTSVSLANFGYATTCGSAAEISPAVEQGPSDVTGSPVAALGRAPAGKEQVSFAATAEGNLTTVVEAVFSTSAAQAQPEVMELVHTDDGVARGGGLLRFTDAAIEEWSWTGMGAVVAEPVIAWDFWTE